MSRRPRSLVRQYALSLLALWYAVLFSSTSVVHAHEFGSVSHGHALGFLSLSSDVQPMPVRQESGSRHRHRVLLGVEFPAEPCLPDDDTDRAVPVAEVKVSNPVSIEANLIDSFALKSKPTVNYLANTAGVWRQQQLFTVRLCPSARHEVAGVRVN